MVKKLLVGVVIVVAAGLMALVSYSYLTSSFSSQERLILREGTGIFWDRDRPPKGRESSPNLGYLAPGFALSDLEGRTVALSDLEDQGKPILLNFWASWCPPCRAEMPDLQLFHEEYGDQVAVLGINWSEDAEKVGDFLRRYGVTYTNLLDRKGRVFVTYRLTGTPTTFFLDPQGIIRGIWLGPLRTEKIVSTMARLAPGFQPQPEDIGP